MASLPLARRQPPEHTLPPVDPLDTRRYMIAIRRLADTLRHGTDRSRFLGSGLFDTPASMTYASTGTSKYQIAAQIAGGLAFACLDRVSPVGLLGTGERELRVNPSLSKDEVMQWLVKLRTYRVGEKTTLARRVTELNARMQNRALVFVLSDMGEEGAVDARKLMAQVHDVIAIQLVDPAEIDLRGVGFLRAEEAETGEAFVTHGRRTFSDPEAIGSELRRGGIDHLLVRTDRPFAQNLRMFLKDRAALAGGRR